MRKIILLLICFYQSFWSLAQEDDLKRLLSEREQLTLEYQYYNKQNNNFWGKKSKKDLLHIIETLKNIINKDSEIIREVNIQNLKKQAQVKVETGTVKRQIISDRQVTLDNIYELKRDLASMQNMQKVKDREINNLKDQLRDTRKRQQDADKILAIAGGVCLVLLIYIFVLRSQKAKPKSRSKR